MVLKIRDQRIIHQIENIPAHSNATTISKILKAIKISDDIREGWVEFVDRCQNLICYVGILELAKSPENKLGEPNIDTLALQLFI